MRIKSLNFVVALTLLLFSCAEEDATPLLEVQDLEVTIENTLVNGDVIGTLEVTSSSSELTFSILSQTEEGAIAIDSDGRLRVANIEHFDFDNEMSLSGSILVVSGALSTEVSFLISLSNLNAYDLAVIDYFKEIALGFEFGNSTEVTRRWESGMRIFVGGTPTLALTDELNLIIAEINTLTNSASFSAQIVNDSTLSNYYTFFGSGDAYARMFPDLSNLITSNWGLLTMFWNGSQQLYTGYMYVDIFRANASERKHLLREEITQSLGLARDSDTYPESIFQQSFDTKVTTYAEIDEALIRLLYHPDMNVGLNETQIDERLRQIIKAEK